MVKPEISRAEPVTDGFGTRIDPKDVVSGLRRLGCPRFVVRLRDREILLSLPRKNIQGETAARALTWLRSVFSPLIPVRVEALPKGAAAGARFVDARKRPLLRVALAEIFGGSGEYAAAAADLLLRLGAGRGKVKARGGARFSKSFFASSSGFAEEIRRAVGAVLPAFGFDARKAPVWVVEDGEKGGAFPPGSPGRRGPQPAFLAWRRPGGEHGVREAALLAASFDRRALAWLVEELRDSPDQSQAFDVLLDGLEWGVARRPTIAVKGRGKSPAPIEVDPMRCSDCGLCAQVCPADCLSKKGTWLKGGADRCLSCFDCVEACPEDALRPTASASSAMLGRAAQRRPGWLSRLRGAPGPALPAPFPPSFLLPKPRTRRKPRTILGLAVTTMAEHAAVLLKDGKVVGAVEEERLARVRHYGWRPEGRPGATLTSDPTLCVEEAFCRRSIGSLLSKEGLTLDDMDVIAINGLPARYRRAYSPIRSDRPIPSLSSGRVRFIPHHLCHAASAYKASGQGKSMILSVDGRGDRETAAVFRASGGKLSPVSEILALTDRSVGGVYETLTRLLGFGAHGQGSVMALASFGSPRFDMGPFLSLRTRKKFSFHESGIKERFRRLTRDSEAPLTQGHRDLAASLQSALEDAIVRLLIDSGAGKRRDGLCLAGGVALNCRMNQKIRQTLRPKRMFIQPAANDAGTALGAALEARAPGAAASVMEHAYLGPEFTDSEIEAALRRAGRAFKRVKNIAGEVAGRLARGQVICWFQGRMEFGPRALGARSILADPRDPKIKDRVNRIKGRASWRPFGPSLLAGYESEWFEDSFDSRFMLFTLAIRKDRRDAVPAIAHVDGTSRPQVVHRETNPLFHELIDRFRGLTGVPLVLNTSFNRRGEPIVCSPQDAVESFAALGADALAIGPFIAEKWKAGAGPAPSTAASAKFAALPGGRRLLLRVTARCDMDCVHCPMRDIMGRPDRSLEQASRALADGRNARCDELVVVRGEAANWPGILELLRRAKAMGYRFVQLQTNGRALAARSVRERLFAAGVDAVEITLLAAEEGLHERLSRSKGTFREVLMGIRVAAASGKEVLVSVPVLRRNMNGLARIAKLVHSLGAKRLQFNFPRPVEPAAGVVAEPLARLTDAAAQIRRASYAAARLGLAVSTEGVPFCHLDAEFRKVPDAVEDWRRFRVDDLDRLTESLDAKRSSSRPEPPVCRTCRYRRTCPKTWASYQALFGTSELIPFKSLRPSKRRS